MNSNEYVITTAIVLFLVYLLGWFSYWLLHRFSRSAGADMNELERMARELHEAEDLRDQAIHYYEARLGELTTRLSQSEAELNAAMEGLRDARAEAEGLKDYVERNSDTRYAYEAPRSYAETEEPTLQLSEQTLESEGETLPAPDEADEAHGEAHEEDAGESEPLTLAAEPEPVVDLGERRVHFDFGSDASEEAPVEEAPAEVSETPAPDAEGDSTKATARKRRSRSKASEA